MTVIPVPHDVIARLKSDFGERSDEACAILEQQRLSGASDYLGDRLLRCIVFLSDGCLDKLKHGICQALEDYRDVIYWAEYDTIGVLRRRDFGHAFGSENISYE